MIQVIVVENMDTDFYLNQFQKIIGGINKKLLAKKSIKVATGLFGKSVFLKLYKISWVNKPSDSLMEGSRIFFSIWINEDFIKEEKIFYNIHALKLRELNGYKITSRNFAADFRKRFIKFESEWPNVDLNFGPQTLMEGWQKATGKSLQKSINNLINQFLQIDFLIDEILADYKIPQ